MEIPAQTTDRAGPALPGDGLVISVGHIEGGGIWAIRFVGGKLPTATWILPDDAKEWQRIYLN